MAAFAGGAISDIFGTIGDIKESQGYETAASLEEQNAQYAKISTQLQETQATRQLFQVQGTTAANAAANGLTLGGSAGDVLRSNAQQGALAKQVIGVQGAIQETNFEQQAAAYKNLAATANAAAAGGALSGALGIANLFGLF